MRAIHLIGNLPLAERVGRRDEPGQPKLQRRGLDLIVVLLDNVVGVILVEERPDEAPVGAD
jgi:hypothetical protein